MSQTSKGGIYHIHHIHTLPAPKSTSSMAPCQLHQLQHNFSVATRALPAAFFSLASKGHCQSLPYKSVIFLPFVFPKQFGLFQRWHQQACPHLLPLMPPSPFGHVLSSAFPYSTPIPAVPAAASQSPLQLWHAACSSNSSIIALPAAFTAYPPQVTANLPHAAIISGHEQLPRVVCLPAHTPSSISCHDHIWP